MAEIFVPKGRQAEGFKVTYTLPSGLAVAVPIDSTGFESAVALSARNGHNGNTSKLIIPSEHNPYTKVVLPNQNPKDGKFSLLLEGEIVRFGNPASGKKEITRTSTEIAQAIYAPQVFLANEARKVLSKPADKLTEEVIANLMEQKEDPQLRWFSKKAARRNKQVVSYYNKDKDTTEKMVKSSPGALESVALAVCANLDEKCFEGYEDRLVFGRLEKLIKEYRLYALKARQTPEMPDLALKLIDSLDSYYKYPHLRGKIYSLLEQTKIPDSLKESLVRKMDEGHDLDHPLAFELTQDIARTNPESAWIKDQQQRRASMLETLKGSNQELFDSYAHLANAASALVYSGDPISPIEGKVGMEIEFALEGQWDHLIYRLPHKYSSSESIYEKTARGLKRDWRLHEDGSHELTRDDKRLMHDRSYISSFTNLYKWFKDYALDLYSLHLHFDDKRHPHKPHLGGLYEDFGEGGRSLKHNDLHTWEARPICVPKVGNSVNPARLEDAIGFYLHATKAENTREEEKITVSRQDENINMKKAVWGHICTYIEDPEGRLAALMSLQDGLAFIAANPFAFVNSYTRESLPYLSGRLRIEAEGKSTLTYLNTLEAVGKGGFQDEVKYLRTIPFQRNIIYNILAYDKEGNADLLRSLASGNQIPSGIEEASTRQINTHSARTREYFSIPVGQRMRNHIEGLIPTEDSHRDIFRDRARATDYRINNQINIIEELPVPETLISRTLTPQEIPIARINSIESLYSLNNLEENIILPESNIQDLYSQEDDSANRQRISGRDLGTRIGDSIINILDRLRGIQ